MIFLVGFFVLFAITTHYFYVFNSAIYLDIVIFVTIHTASLVVTLNTQITASGNADFLSIAQNFDSH